MSRWRDRSIPDARHSGSTYGYQRPRMCLELVSRKPSWPAVMCNRRKQAGHMIAIDLVKSLPITPCKREAVHICKREAVHIRLIELGNEPPHAVGLRPWIPK